jgi:phage prohead protease, HK97 family
MLDLLDQEARALGEIELRYAADKRQPILEGYAARFGALSADQGGFRERYEPGCFTEALARLERRTLDDDCLCLFNHDKNQVLGRHSAGTLELSQDNVGLRVRAYPDIEQTWVRDLLRKVERRDVRGQSLAMRVFKVGGATWEPAGADGLPIRSVKRVGQLVDVGPVSDPAYATSTDIALRGLREWNEEQARLAEEAAKIAEANAARRERWKKLLDKAGLAG